MRHLSTWKGMKRGSLLAVLLCSSAAFAAVKTETGQVEGTAQNGMTVYLGVPFAAPPVGDLRWRAPQPAAEWTGVKTANAFAPACTGGGSPSGIRTQAAAKGKAPAPAPLPAQAKAKAKQGGGFPGGGGSEDCLYLNVWTPAKAANERLPVMVWVYGGGFVGGSTAGALTTGERLASKGVVVVSVAYRVGPLGYLAHPGLSTESKDHVSGNYGVLDLVAGLQWVKKNIAAFGGNPGAVTIFGESAGGIAVSMLSASPLAKGLFHGAISESGGSFGPPSLPALPGENMLLMKDAEKLGQEFAAKAGAASVADLRKLPAVAVVAAAGGSEGITWPVIDGHVLPEDQYKMYEAKRFNDTPVLVGYNSDEGLSFGVAATPDAYRQATHQRYGPYADRLLAAYPTDPDRVTKTARDLTRDAAFGWATWSWARLQAQRGKGKAYLYYFDQHPDYPADSPQAGRGSAHGSEIQYVFQHLPANATESDKSISETMAIYWTNFAKKGDPNGPGVPAWPAYNDRDPQSMYFSQTAKVGPVPSLASMKILDEYFAWRRTPEGMKFGTSGQR
ncbi:MAG: carboxylesterase family protein [Acidobacteriota bacterium]